MIKRLSYSKVYYIFLISFLLLLFILGIIYFKIVNSVDTYNFNEVTASFFNDINNFRNKDVLITVLIMPLSLLLSFLFIGPVILLIYLGYQTFSAGFILGLFIKIYGIKGILFSVSYFFLFKLIMMGIIMVFTLYLLKISYLCFCRFVLKKENNFIIKIQKYFKRELFTFLLLLCFNTVIYIWGGKIYSFIAFLN